MSAVNASKSDLDGYLDVEERDSVRMGQRNFWLLARHILRQRGPLLGGISMVLLGTGAVLIEPRLFGYAIDEAIVPKDWEKLKGLAILFLFVVCVRASATIAQSYLFELLGQRVTQDLRCQLFSHLQRLPVAIYDKNPAGRLLTRVTNDVAALGEMFSAGFLSMISNILTILGIAIWLIILNPKLGLIALAIFPVMMGLGVYFSKKLSVAYRDARSKLSALNAFLAENLLGMRVVFLFNRQKRHLERFDRINQWYANAQIGTVRLFAFFQPSITWCTGIAMTLVIWFGGQEALQGHIKIGILFAYFSYVLALFQPVREVADKWNTFLSGMASAERIFSILSWTPELERGSDRKAPEPPAGIRGHIVFENVWFAYEGEHWVLKDFSWEIKPGMKVGIVGHTGAGKTTLISLLMRFYEPQKGRILLDGSDLRTYEKRALRSLFGIIQQDVFLFSGSFRDNISLWKGGPGLDRADGPVRTVLRSVGHENWWEDGTETQLQERGSNLSMGEKQVVAFARALTAEPRIWILDEATANMDSDSERILGTSLERAAQNLTTLLIAHRLATVRMADEILVLHKGVSVERGTHQKLLHLNGLYARLYRYQEAQEKQQIGAQPGSASRLSASSTRAQQP